MPRQLVLFAGLHKTGSTSIQHTCSMNQRSLVNAGFAYPVLGYSGRHYRNHTGAFHFMFRGEPHKFGPKRRKPANAMATRSRLRQLVSCLLQERPETPVMVAEGVSIFTIDELREMKRWFNERDYSIRVICYVRRLSSWINSMVSQRVTGFQRRTIKSALAEFLELSGLVRPRIANIREVFPDAEFYSFEAALRHRFGPVGFFFEAIGISEMEKLDFARANEGRSDCATRLISSINETRGRTYVTGELNQRVADNDISGLQIIPGAKFSLRLDEVAPLLPLLAEENEWLKETIGKAFYDEHLVFSNEPCVWPEESLSRLREVSSTSTPLVRSLISSYLAALEQRSVNTQ